MSRATLAGERSFSKKRCPIVFICLLIIYPGLSPYTALAYAGLPWPSPGLTVVRIDPVTKNAAPGHTFTINVMVDGAVNLGAFQFDMIYDPAVVTVTNVELGTFLGSTGRTAQPVGSNIDNAVGIVTFGAFSFGSNAGPEGTGLLAAVTLMAMDSGTSALNLQNVVVTDTMANAQSTSVEGGTVTVAAPAPTSTPTMIPSPTVTPTATPTLTSTATATETAKPAATATPTDAATATTTSEAMITPTAPPLATGTATPVATAVPTPTGPLTSTPAEATATSEAVITPTTCPVVTGTATPVATAVPTPTGPLTPTPAEATATSEAMITPTTCPVATGTATPVTTAVPTPTGPLTPTPTETSQPKATVASTPSPTPGAVLSRMPTFTPPPLKPLATLTAVKLLTASPVPPSSSTSALSSPLYWLLAGGMFLFIAGYIFRVLLRRHRE